MNQFPIDGGLKMQVSQVVDRQDIYSTFNEVAKATGGLTLASASTGYLMQQAASAAENYYLLYYSPRDKKQDGKFRNIRVQVKTGNYQISYMEGYFAK